MRRRYIYPSLFFALGKYMASGSTIDTREIETRTFSDFLESSPPNQLVRLSDMMDVKWKGVGRGYVLKTPDIQLHCTEDSCNGIRFHRCTNGYDISITEGTRDDVFITYVCSNCQTHTKVYSLRTFRESNEEGLAFKYGEYPIYGPPIPQRLLKLIGPDRDNFLKGRRCETQGLGIGAFAYYRRVVEHQKNRILKEIVKVSEKIGAPKEKVDILNSALLETQFSKALDMAKDALPESLLIKGHSPLKLLYSALSEGIHNLDDEECLAIASSVRIVLGDLSDRLSQALKDEAEITNAISRLLSPKKS